MGAGWVRTLALGADLFRDARRVRGRKFLSELNRPIHEFHSRADLPPHAVIRAQNQVRRSVGGQIFREHASDLGNHAASAAALHPECIGQNSVGVNVAVAGGEYAQAVHPFPRNFAVQVKGNKEQYLFRRVRTKQVPVPLPVFFIQRPHGGRFIRSFQS